MVRRFCARPPTIRLTRAGVENVAADASTQTVLVVSRCPFETIRRAIEQTGRMVVLRGYSGVDGPARRGPRRRRSEAPGMHARARRTAEACGRVQDATTALRSASWPAAQPPCAASCAWCR